MPPIHRRYVPPMQDTRTDPSSLADHGCDQRGPSFCPACDPVLYAALASRHASDNSRKAAGWLTETVLSWT